uniref:BTB domain-containing protein n=1 Tax=Arundo donax TaxID=35708 RepID=A0A0A9FVT4_ARUDO
METPKTVSMCTPEKAQGTHVFDVFGYSLHRGVGVGRCINSGIFSVGGHDWAIRFYPDGFNGSSKDYISVFLELMSKGALVRASCDIRLVNQTTGLSSSVYQIAPRVFCPSDSSRLAPQDGDFKRRSELEASAYLRDDHLRIECMVTVMKEPRVSEPKSFPRIKVPPSDITAHLGKLLETEKGADVTFSVGGETFAAHKVILATRSPVFSAELYGPMKENGTQVITIKDMQPAVFKALLHFIYTDSLPAVDDIEGDDRSEMIRHLLVAADRYAMDRLKLVCQSTLCEGLDMQTVVTTLALADQHHCNMLKDACIEFISSSAIEDIMATQGFVDLKRNCPSVLVDALVKMSIIRKT